MFSLYAITLVASWTIYANAELLYFSEMPLSIPGNYSVFSYDTSTKQVEKVGGGEESSYTAYDFVSGSASCGNMYYSSAVQTIVSWGLEVMDTSSGDVKIFTTEELRSTRIFHNIYCDTSGAYTLVTVQSTTDGIFSVWGVDVTGSGSNNWKVTQTKIGDFATTGDYYYVGSDTIFASTFSATNEIYASFSNQKYTSGSFEVMTMDGNVKTYEIKGAPGYPYASVPLSTDSKQFTGLINDSGNTKQVTFTFNNDDSVSLSNEVDAEQLYTGSMPWSYSSKTNQVYAMTSHSTGPQSILIMNTDLEIQETISIASLIGQGDHKCGGLTVNM